MLLINFLAFVGEFFVFLELIVDISSFKFVLIVKHSPNLVLDCLFDAFFDLVGELEVTKVHQ